MIVMPIQNASTIRQHSARIDALNRAERRIGRKVKSLERASLEFSRFRLSLGLAFAIALGLVFVTDSSAIRFSALVTIALVTIVFIVTANRHSRTLGSLRRFQVWFGLYSEKQARLCRDWDSLPAAFDGLVSKDHPFGTDLQILGPRSVHHLVDIAVTREGRQRLADWLLSESPSIDEVEWRQRLVTSLVKRSLFRDRIVLSGRVQQDSVDLRPLTSWLQSDGRSPSVARALALTRGLAGINYVLFALWAFQLLPPFWALSVGVYFAVYNWRASGLSQLYDRAENLVSSLRPLTEMFRFVESRPQSGCPALQDLCASFWENETKPSVLIRRARRVAGATAFRKNPILWVLLNTLFPWDLFFAHRLESLRLELKTVLPEWLDTWASLEAAASLAQFAELNDRPLAEISSNGTPVFEAHGLVHPLLPPPDAIPNSIRFDQVGEAAIVTGSNMTGKSTFLRALGTNLALANAGGAVTALHLKTHLYRLHAVLNVADSVQDGFSYFYAEVRRLKFLLDAIEDSEGLPVFFLIDEILRGTNNRERFLGSSSYVAAISAAKSSVGLLATHDLDLARLDVGGFTNVHFRDRIESGRMVFDYTLHEGPSETTNALRVLEAEGLPTPPSGQVATPDAISLERDQ